MVAYTGSDWSTVSLQPLRNTHTNDLSVRFRTPKHSGLLFVASSRGITDYIRAFLEDGMLKLETNVGGVMPVTNYMSHVNQSVRVFRYCMSRAVKQFRPINQSVHQSINHWFSCAQKLTRELANLVYGT